ncbi:NADH-quinone oxidoreductase subunit C [Salipaludibacillus sp. CF4.18]|uniref:NADH-quinone oxidoreductase subunit C n=1 Tax=Salipaludibacillus sp. CF4.18 TaxID=3373081 RepID=UPI003EE6C0E7
MSQELLDLIAEKIHTLQGADTIEEAKLNFHKPMIILASQNWDFNTVNVLRTDESLQFDFLSCVSAIDYEEHMEVIYNFYSTRLDHYLYVKVKTPRGNPVIISLEPVYKAADYMEREIYDLMGIDFTGHWNLKRILLPDEWEGHPLRKDYVTDKKALGLD